MSLINTGRGLQKSAYSGFGTVAQLEAKRDAEYEAMLAAEDAQKKSLMGTFGGIGGSYGVKNAMDAAAATKDAVSALNTSLQGMGTVGAEAGGLTYAPAQAAIEGTVLTGEGAQRAINAATSAADIAAGTSAATTQAATAATQAATATTQAATATSAAAASSPLATLSAIATPLAIGVGLAYLLNELF